MLVNVIMGERFGEIGDMMFNYMNLNDYEFENLCGDVMSKKLGIELRKFAPGRDGGIDLVDDLYEKNIIVQVKHYIRTDIRGLISSLKKELSKVEELKPKQYYICCSKELTPDNVSEIYSIFQDYMESDANIITLNEIDDFLHKEDNCDVLKKHYKLWIESTNILSEIFTGDICIDCEALLYDIEKDVKYFVETTIFKQALKRLSKNHILFITGDPGVGKTITSKMLVLYYASRGYRIRYTTDGTDLAALKRALSQSPDTKEVILLDDCLGQAYFNMKESQGNELTALINHVKIHESKRLILNSRVTIYKEALERSYSFGKSLENKNYQPYIIDLSVVTNMEKAQILYNHIYFSEVGIEYYKAIKKNKNYARIITHPNYNPRIIEYICNPKHFSHISAERYFDFIIDNLDRPFHIWKNEYEDRLDSADRLLLTTLYSMSNNLVSLNFLKECYNRRIQGKWKIDLSLDQFERALKRLEHAFIKIVDYKDEIMVSVSNPSINDFLDSYLSDDTSVYDQLVNSCCSLLQLNRMLSEEDYLDKVREIFENGTVLDYCFESDSQKCSLISYYVSHFGIKRTEYEEFVRQYLDSMGDISIVKGKTLGYAKGVIDGLTNEDMVSFYNLQCVFNDTLSLKNILSHFSFPDVIDAISCIDPFICSDRESYHSLVEDILKDSVSTYCDSIDAYDYLWELDLDGIINDCTYNDPNGAEVDEYETARIIEDQIIDFVRNEIVDEMERIVEGYWIEEFVDKLKISVSGCDYVVSDYLEEEYGYDDDDWRDGNESHVGNRFSEIELLFK